MQIQLSDAFERENIAYHSEFMRQLSSIVNEDRDQANLLYATLFEMMHLNLKSIKLENFRSAESQLDTIKTLLENKEAQEVFVGSEHFLGANLNGRKIQMETYLGRYLSFSCLPNETKSFKDTYFKGLSKTSQQGIQKMTETVAELLHRFHNSIADVISKLLKNKDCKERVLQWLRLSVGLNQEKQKMFTQVPVSSDGFIMSLIDVMLILSKPFTSRFADYHQYLTKINTFYLYNDTYILNASKIDKIDNESLQLL